jgi:hypothetical protein
MSNVWDEMRRAISASRDTLRAADNVAADMAGLLRGRLERVPPYILVELKRELQRFDAHKKEWKP